MIPFFESFGPRRRSALGSRSGAMLARPIHAETAAAGNTADLDTPPGFATVVDDCLSHAFPHRRSTMTPPIRLSTQAWRTGHSPISDLMARALAAPDLISLAAGFVDHATLPVESAARATSAVL